ncbi:uncharacterized protein JN550_013382 [Neoarthrinium moseri]|uniref:uncharacterized protein n=1 Tax=Neoarthrinium moseri TaxID=1658444 RepID=UPI001FDCB203|nr:uncharacterized protein JN550_013382 [Neoarthrinium moseri]KAI1857247.1 hypothetical protein JN550_013382 [Neoarthrinium moseri]
MPLHRKPGFHRGCDLVVARAYPLITINGYPESDCEKVQQTGAGWIGVPWRDRGRLVRVEHAPHMTITDFESLVNLRHLHVAPFLGLYYNRTSTDIVYERLDLDLLEICPLASEAEVASVLAQVLSAIMHLLSSPVDARIASVRISMFGLVKLSTRFRLTVSMFCVGSATAAHCLCPVLDFRHKPTTDIIHRNVMHRFMVSYIEQVAKVACPRSHVWTFDAADFLDILYAGELPPLSVRTWQ